MEARDQLQEFRKVIDPLIRGLAERIIQEAMAPGLYYITPEGEEVLTQHVAYELVDQLDGLMARKFSTGDRVRWYASGLLQDIDNERFEQELSKGEVDEDEEYRELMMSSAEGDDLVDQSLKGV